MASEKEKHQNIEQLLSDNQLNELRQIILGLNREEVDHLHRLFKDPHEFSAEISNLLPHSINKLIEDKTINKEELIPFLENLVQNSVHQNPKRLADILFPVMGPAIRKAVAEDLKKMVESLNQGLESGVSPKYLKWRLQALFSNKTYAEILLSKAYVYHVKEVFLIHRQTGLMLRHETDDEMVSANADMVASMLSAISDFVKDSFHTNDNEGVEMMRVGDTNIWIEQGPHAAVAAVVDGNPPPDLRLTMKEAVEAIHYNFTFELEKFSGETSPFSKSSKFLRTCLQKEKVEQEPKPPYFAIVLMVILFLIAGVLLYFHFERKYRWNKFMAQLEQADGVVVTDNFRQSGKYVIRGLKDKQAIDVGMIYPQFGFDSSDVDLQFKSFISLDANLVLKRARMALKEPETINLSYDSGVLYLKGSAADDWLEEARKIYVRVWGIDRLDETGLQVDEPKVVAKEVPDLNWILKVIERTNFTYLLNENTLNTRQEQLFDSLQIAAKLLDSFNLVQEQKYVLQVLSYTSRISNMEANTKIADARATSIIQRLEQAGVPPGLLKKQVVYVEDVEVPGAVRSVAFKLVEEENK